MTKPEIKKYYPGQNNWDNRAHVAQARDLSSMHVPMFGLRACLNFLARVSRRHVLWEIMSVSTDIEIYALLSGP